MKIILTGALGYIGSEALHRFSLRPDITVYAVDNDRYALQERGAYFIRYPNITLINCDVTKADQVNLLPSADLIVHLAAVVGYLNCNKNPELTYKTNVIGTENISRLNIPRSEEHTSELQSH